VNPDSELEALVTLADFEAIARRRMEPAHFDYVAGGAGDELTIADNGAAWRRWRLRPRVLVDVSRVDCATTVLGCAVALPVGVAPVAFQHFAHADAETATAGAAAGAGALFCLSTMSSRSLEEVAAAADGGGDAGAPRWFQLYVHRDRDRSEELVRRAAAAGYSAIVVTVDFPVAGRRERDLRNRLPYPPVYGNFELPPVESGEGDGGGGEGGGDGVLAAAVGAWNDAALTWRDLAWLRGLTDLPLVVKGVLTAADARLAADHGAAAVVVSNHGGRQLDRAVASADALPEVVEEAGDRLEVYVDGGIRRGVDVVTALALGARGVLIGRPLIYALAAGGAAGVARAFEILRTELLTDMALLGITSLAEVNRDFVVRSP